MCLFILLHNIIYVPNIFCVEIGGVPYLYTHLDCGRSRNIDLDWLEQRYKISYILRIQVPIPPILITSFICPIAEEDQVVPILHTLGLGP